MKMSEAVNLPWSVNQWADMNDGVHFTVADFSYSNIKVAKAAAHAVNCHDELVEALTGLTNAYEALDGAQKSEGSLHSHAIAALKKANAL